MNNNSVIPLFPLPIAVLPGETMPLHIFEQRYQALVADCRDLERGDGTSSFGLSFAVDDTLREVGCLVRITEIAHEYKDGRIDIITVGVRRYRIVELFRDRSLYIQAEVEFLDDLKETKTDPTLRNDAIQIHSELLDQLETSKTPIHVPDDAEASWLLAQQAGLEAKQKQELLEMYEENKRLKFLIRYFKRLLLSLNETTAIRKRIKANGFFRQLKGIDV